MTDREQIAKAIERANVLYQHGAGSGASRWTHLADAVLALIDKENTMPDDTTIATIEQRATQIEGFGPAFADDAETLRRAVSILEQFTTTDPPKPPAPRLRVVNLDEGRTHTYSDGTRMSFANLEAQPDVLTVIDEAIDGYEALIAKGGRDDLKARIGAALGVE